MKTKTENKRQGRREFYSQKEKEILRLLRRRDELSKIKWLGRKPENKILLDVPRRDGWVRTVILRADIARSSEAPRLHRLLNLIAMPQRCDNKEFLVDVRSSFNPWTRNGIGWEATLRTIRTHFKKGAAKMEMPIHFKEYSEEQFEKQVPDELKKYFSFFVNTSRWGGQQYKTYYVPVSYKFDTVVKPYWITHIDPLYTEIEAELDYLDNRLWNLNEAVIWTDKFDNGRNHDDWNHRAGKNKSQIRHDIQNEIEKYFEERNQRSYE